MKSVKQKILLFGPIGDFGGRELESGFIASVLSSKYEVVICTTGTITSKSQVFDFNKNQRVVRVKEFLVNRFFDLKLFAFLSFLKNGCKGKVSDFVNNGFAKRFFDYDRKVQIVLEHLIKDYEVVFVVAQLSSALVSDVIKLAKNKNKKVLFRTTGTNTFSDYDFIDLVDCFIHHSLNNAKKIGNNHMYTIIDQCAYNERELLDISTVKNKVKVFLTIGRLEKGKNIDIIIKAFFNISNDDDKLIIVGDGEEYANLQKLAKSSRNIVFTGFIPNHKIANFFTEADCVIISHYDLETGPLTGIEAMCASRLIISAKTGAMEERLREIGTLWFDNSVESLSEQMINIKKLKIFEVLNVSNQIRSRYLDYYSKDEIASKYQNVLNNLFNTNRLQPPQRQISN